MRRIFQGVGEIAPCEVRHLVLPPLPEKAPGHVVDLAVVGDVGRRPIQAVVLRQLFLANSSRSTTPPGRRT